MSDVFNKGGSDKDGLDKDLPDEQQLEEYLRGGSAVSQQYRQLRSTDVPTELDRLVLRQAQEAVKARPAKSRAWMRWAGPLALAASTVLVVSIVIESGVHEETYVAAPDSVPADLPKPVASQVDQAREKAAAGSAADKNVVQLVPVQPAVIEDDFADSPPAAIMPEAPAPAPAPAPAEDRALAFEPAAPPAPAAAAPVDQMPAELARRQEADSNARASAKTVAPIAPVPEFVPARARPQARKEDDSAGLEEIAVTGIRRSTQKQTAGPRNTVAPPAAGSADVADEREDEPRTYSDPEQWLRDIRKLRAQYEHEKADREWRRFRSVFPNYEVADKDLARGSQ